MVRIWFESPRDSNQTISYESEHLCHGGNCFALGVHVHMVKMSMVIFELQCSASYVGVG